MSQHPADAVSPVSALIRARISSAIACADPTPRISAVTSRYASSSDSGSTSGVKCAKIAQIWSDTAR